MSNPFLDRVNYVPEELPAPIVAPVPVSRTAAPLPWGRLVAIALLLAASLTFSL